MDIFWWVVGAIVLWHVVAVVTFPTTIYMLVKWGTCGFYAGRDFYYTEWRKQGANDGV